jgi:hypothetical protein
MSWLHFALAATVVCIGMLALWTRSELRKLRTDTDVLISRERRTHTEARWAIERGLGIPCGNHLFVTSPAEIWKKLDASLAELVKVRGTADVRFADPPKAPDTARSLRPKLVCDSCKRLAGNEQREGMRCAHCGGSFRFEFCTDETGAASWVPPVKTTAGTNRGDG